MEVIDLMTDVYQELEHIRKLSSANSEKRFNRLYRLVSKPEFLEMAWNAIKNNKGSRTPGLNGRTRDDVDEDLIRQISQALTSGTYRHADLRRGYVPKKNGKRRPIGIADIDDRIVQSAVKLILEALYEPHFRHCSHGFRPKHSTISALREVAIGYRAGADWTIEGDIKACFDSIPHRVILELLRQRVRDERFMALIAQMLKAGVMEEGKHYKTYSGTPQGGVVSPVIANIVLHKFDVWMEAVQGANPPKESQRAYRQRQTPRYKQLTRRIKYLRELLKKGAPFPKGRSAAELKTELEQLEAERRQTLPSIRRRAIRYVRYADDWLVILSGMTRTEAQALKEQIGRWLWEELGLTLSVEKTLITHASETIRFLGYNIQGLRNPNGTRWARLSIPVEARRSVVEKLRRATRYRHAPELDVFINVNAIARGWCYYYRYAYDAQERFSRLTGIVYWMTVHYIKHKHDLSVRKVMRKRYARDPKTGRMALFTNHPNGNQYFIWNRYPKQVSIFAAGGWAEDRQPYLVTAWADGHSMEKKAKLVAAAGGKCEACGRDDVPLIAHHPRRLRNAAGGTASQAASGYEQKSKLVCHDCHLAHHHGDTRRK